MVDENTSEQDWLEPFRQIESHVEIPAEPSISGIAGPEEDTFVRVYEIKGTGGELYIETGEAVREDGYIVEGSLGLAGYFKGGLIKELREQLMNTNATGYIEPVVEESRRTDTGRVAVPTDYDPEVLDETVEAAIQTAQEHQTVQDELRETLDEQAEALL